MATPDKRKGDAAGAANPERNYRRGFVQRQPEGWMDECKPSQNCNVHVRTMNRIRFEIIIHRENVFWFSCVAGTTRKFLCKLFQRVLY